MARGDDLINLIIALAVIVGSVAKDMKKTLAIIREMSKGIKKPIKTETLTAPEDEKWIATNSIAPYLTLHTT